MHFSIVFLNAFFISTTITAGMIKRKRGIYLFAFLEYILS